MSSHSRTPADVEQTHPASKFHIRLSGSPIYHEGDCVGRHGVVVNSGDRVFVEYTSRLKAENAYAISETILEQIDEDIELLAFRNKLPKDLMLFEAWKFFDEEYEKRMVFGPDQYANEVQVAVERYYHDGLYEGQGDGFRLSGGKYDAIDDI